MLKGILSSILMVSFTVASVYADSGSTDLNTMKKNIKNRADKHIVNIKNFESCVEKATKPDQIKVCKTNMEKTNIKIQQESGM